MSACPKPTACPFPSPARSSSLSRAVHGLLAVLLRTVLLAPLLSAGCSRQNAPAADSVLIGVVLPITGREAKPGQYQKEGIELAIKKINAAGGVFVKSAGKKLLLKETFYDDGSDQAKSAALVERAITADHVSAVIGGYSTALGQAQSVMPDRYQTPWITPGTAAAAVFSQGYQYCFGTLSPITLLGSTTAEFLRSLVDDNKLARGLKIALAIENTDHGVEYATGIQDWIKDHPGYFEVVFNEKFELGSPDFSGLLQKIRSSNADVLLSDAHLQDYIVMHRQYLQSGMQHKMISYGARGSESDARKALGDGTDYIFSGIWWSSMLPYPQVQAFVKEYSEFTGHAPDSYYAAPAHDAVRALVSAVEQAGSLDKTAVRDALRKVELKDSLLPGGVLRFGANGQIATPFVVVQNKPGGKVDIVYPKDAATGPAIAPRPEVASR
jgi:branched-chain amino acid transport system substrate-binding protein